MHSSLVLHWTIELEQIKYIGEHIIEGKIGFFLLQLVFVFALLSFVFSLLSFLATSKKEIYKTLTQSSFTIHSIALFSSIGLLFYFIFNGFYEYHYVWQHSSKALPLRYIFSCFWEGQEGSFLLWLFWNALIGLFIFYRYKNQNASVLLIGFLGTQTLLSSMLLGIELGGIQIGSNPFNLLLREHLDFMHMPLFTDANYLEKLDGRGLNPLLQNYWMTIHPPTLFLGFALCGIPFSMAIGAMLSQDYSTYFNKALPWTFLSIGVLGIGILMGGAWAYEALSFGGFWAWDPVENASLVPWILMVCAGHMLLIYKAKRAHIKTTLFFLYLSFVTLVYSTFLTRSGILGDTSVHAFVDLGLNGQLLFFLLSIIVLPIVIFILNYPSKAAKEELFWSKEFWMYMANTFLLLSALQITLSTSLPVMNKIMDFIGITGTKLAPSSNIISHYHKFQIPILIVFLVFFSGAQWLYYTKDHIRRLQSKIIYGTVLSLLSGILIYLLLPSNFGVGIEFSGSSFLKSSQHLINKSLFIVLLIALIFALYANLSAVKKISQSFGSLIAHVGFIFILLGALLSMGTQKVISKNSSGIDIQSLSTELENSDNILLYKNDTLNMPPYYLVYRGMQQDGIYTRYRVDFLNRNSNGNYSEAFTLYPSVQKNQNMGNVSEPDTKHYLDKDIYAHVTYALLEPLEQKDRDQYTEKPKTHLVQQGDTFFTSNAMVILKSINKAMNTEDLGLDKKDIAVGAFLEVKDMTKNTYQAKPIFVVDQKGIVKTLYSDIDELGLRFVFSKIDPDNFSFQIDSYEKNKNYKEFIVLKTLEFKYINLLWMGCILLLGGCLIAVFKRIGFTQ